MGYYPIIDFTTPKKSVNMEHEMFRGNLSMQKNRRRSKKVYNYAYYANGLPCFATIALRFLKVR
jgi:hypothetical protein